jgi:hypothetical protein
MELGILISKHIAGCILTQDITASFSSSTLLKAKALK